MSQRANHGRNSAQAVSALDFLNYNFYYRRFALKSQSNYEFYLKDSLPKNPKVFHSYIRRKKVGTPSVGPLKDVNGDMITDSKAIADIFVNYFVSVFTLAVPQSPATHQVCDGHMDDVIFSLEHIHDSFQT